jgi:hypothetical protein
MKMDKVKLMLLTLGILNIIVGVSIMLFVQPTGVKVTGISCITIGISCLTIYYVKRKES